MEKMEQYKENGLSIEARSKINTIIGVIMTSYLSNKEKTESINFMRQIEEYFDGEEYGEV